jgi:hypothetical protein
MERLDARFWTGEFEAVKVFERVNIASQPFSPRRTLMVLMSARGHATTGWGSPEDTINRR